MNPAISNIHARLATLTHSDFWFQDGNIVLITGPAAFKVHRGQLERHSEVFHDLFSIPQPKEQELVDGCLWVELHDSPTDVYYFLGALYDGLYFEKPRASDYPAIAAVLRLSTKYLVDHLRIRCLRRLECDWPSTLAGWDKREQEATDEAGHYLPRESCPHPILMINIAMELNLNFLLPAAFYDLSRYGPSKIMMGTESAPPARQLSTNDPCGGCGDILHVCLSQDFLFKTLLGRECAQRYITLFIGNHLNARMPAPDCANNNDNASQPCRESFYFIMLNILRSVGGIACGRDGDALFTLVQAMDMLSRTDFSDGEKQCGLKICAACKADFAQSVKKARAEVWAQIPAWFGLEFSIGV